MNKQTLSVRKFYVCPRTRIVRLGSGRDLCDITFQGTLGAASSGEKNGDLNLSGSYGMGFFDDSAVGAWDAFGE